MDQGEFMEELQRRVATKRAAGLYSVDAPVTNRVPGLETLDTHKHWWGGTVDRAHGRMRGARSPGWRNGPYQAAAS